MLEYRYGTDYPEQCPPENATSANHSLYRACHTYIENDNSLNIENFIPVYETPGRKFMAHQECQAKALSFYDDIETLKNKILDYPNIGDRIIHIQLNSDCGVVLKTGKNHYSIWDYATPSIVEAIGDEWREVALNV